MSEYRQFVQERDRIDFLIDKGFKIINILENLNGAFVDFEKKDGENSKTETLHIQTADGRKYFSVVLIKQQRNTA